MPSRLVTSSLGWILTDTMYTPLPSPECFPYPVSSPIHICTLRFPSRHIANNAACWACISSRMNRYEVNQPRRGKEITTTCHFSSPRPDTPFFCQREEGKRRYVVRFRAHLHARHALLGDISARTGARMPILGGGGDLRIACEKDQTRLGAQPPRIKCPACVGYSGRARPF